MFKLTKKNHKGVDVILFKDKNEDKVLDKFVSYIIENTLTVYTKNDLEILRRDKFEIIDDYQIYVSEC